MSDFLAVLFISTCFITNIIFDFRTRSKMRKAHGDEIDSLMEMLHQRVNESNDMRYRMAQLERELSMLRSLNNLYESISEYQEARRRQPQEPEDDVRRMEI